jgi:type VI protein secretion system component VasK
MANYHPYSITSDSGALMMLALNRNHQWLHVIINRMLPVAIVVIILLFVPTIYHQGTLDWQVVLAFGVTLLVCLILLGFRSVKEIELSKGKIDVYVDRWWRHQTESYDLVATDFISWEKQSGRGANWCFRLHQNGKETLLIRLPIQGFLENNTQNRDAFITLFQERVGIKVVVYQPSTKTV